MVMLNLSPQPQVVNIADSGISGTFQELFSERETQAGEQYGFVLLPWASQVWFDK